MRWRDRFGEDAGALAELWRLGASGRTVAALRAAERLAGRPGVGRYARVQAHINRIGALVNLGRTTQYTAALEDGFRAVQGIADRYPHGHLHALAALAAREQGAPERSLTHLVYAQRALDESAREGEPAAAWGWHDLAMAYSYLGFHAPALNAIARARELAGKPSGPPAHMIQPGIRLRMALSMDHTGDTDGCLRVLRDLAGELSGRPSGIRPTSLVAYGYALARWAAMGARPAAEARPLLLAGAEGQRVRDMRRLGDVCLQIASGEAGDALARLDTVTVAPETFGAAEPDRLRSLAHAALGDHAAAHRADRRAFRLAAARTDRLRDLVLDGIAARLDQEDLRRTAAAHPHHEPLTDPLTGLANRQYLDRYLAALAARGERAAVGVVTVDGLSAVHAGHGRLSGDLVRQRVAGVVARVLRSGDFLARYDGDALAVVLPEASAGHAEAVTRRITSAVAAEDWGSLVPGTSVAATVDWRG